MTEKIARRGIKTPHHYEPDVLEKLTVGQVMKPERLVMSDQNTVRDVRQWLEKQSRNRKNYIVIVNNQGFFKGILNVLETYSRQLDPDAAVDTLITRQTAFVQRENSLREAVELMAVENLDVLPVLSDTGTGEVVGVLSYKDILGAYRQRFREDEVGRSVISIRRSGIKILLRGQKLWKNNG